MNFCWHMLFSLKMELYFIPFTEGVSAVSSGTSNLSKITFTSFHGLLDHKVIFKF